MSRAGTGDRGLASGIIIFFMILIVAAAVYIALNIAAVDLFATSSAYTDNTAAQDHIDLLETVWEGVLVFALFLAMLFIFARAVLESRRPG